MKLAMKGHRYVNPKSIWEIGLGLKLRHFLVKKSGSEPWLIRHEDQVLEVNIEVRG